jgi:hypothetical protein
MFHSLKALNFNGIKNINPGVCVAPLNVSELVSDFMEEGSVTFKNIEGVDKTISSLSVSSALTKKVHEFQLTEVFELARKQDVFQLTKGLRNLIKIEAAKQIEAAFTV